MRILFTWEMGANYGHLNRLAPIANAKIASGDQVLFAVRDRDIALQVLAPLNIDYVQAPLLPLGSPADAPANFAEILLASGYDHQEALFHVVGRWLALFKQFQPEIVVVDHSPTVLLACRIAAIPVVQIGNGFEIPPADDWPSIRPWAAVSNQRLAESGSRLLGKINSVTAHYKISDLDRPQDLFGNATKILSTLPELDHYGLRPRERYISPIYPTEGKQDIFWSDSGKKKIFFYAWPSLPGLSAIFSALGEFDVEVIAVVPDLSSEAHALYSCADWRIFTSSVNFSPLRDGCDLLISHAAFGTVSAFLQSGVPSLAVPCTAEQYMFGKKIEEAGCGVLIGTSRKSEIFAQSINTLLGDDQIRSTTLAKANRWADLSPARSLDQIVLAVRL